MSKILWVASIYFKFQKHCSDLHNGLTKMKSEDHPTEIHLQDGCLPFIEMCHQKNLRPIYYCEPHIQVKSEKVQPDECNNNIG